MPDISIAEFRARERGKIPRRATKSAERVSPPAGAAAAHPGPPKRPGSPLSGDPKRARGDPKRAGAERRAAPPPDSGRGALCQKRENESALPGASYPAGKKPRVSRPFGPEDVHSADPAQPAPPLRLVAPAGRGVRRAAGAPGSPEAGAITARRFTFGAPQQVSRLPQQGPRLPQHGPRLPLQRSQSSDGSGRGGREERPAAPANIPPKRARAGGPKLPLFISSEHARRSPPARRSPAAGRTERRPHHRDWQLQDNGGSQPVPLSFGCFPADSAAAAGATGRDGRAGDHFFSAAEEMFPDPAAAAAAPPAAGRQPRAGPMPFSVPEDMFPDPTAHAPSGWTMGQEAGGCDFEMDAAPADDGPSGRPLFGFPQPSASGVPLSEFSFGPAAPQCAASGDSDHFTFGPPAHRRRDAAGEGGLFCGQQLTPADPLGGTPWQRPRGRAPPGQARSREQPTTQAARYPSSGGSFELPPGEEGWGDWQGLEPVRPPDLSPRSRQRAEGLGGDLTAAEWVDGGLVGPGASLDHWPAAQGSEGARSERPFARDDPVWVPTPPQRHRRRRREPRGLLEDVPLGELEGEGLLADQHHDSQGSRGGAEPLEDFDAFALA
eukprot:TRINITY_DN11679_c0_g1_i6.p1 TRINITY_DN11679_c0_g1~~TRINITY_DN11679_c0_g1_i6.p1  ORF type:complete len:654 (+),score=132.66 TRINITY_DN11679_c0_g1_i6:142-1962(+)